MKEKSILHRIIYYMNSKRIDPSMRKLWIFFILFNILLFFIPRNISRASIWILVPMIGLFIYALVTKDVFQSSLMGTLSLYILWYKWNAITAFFNDCKIVLADSENIEMYMPFFLCGGLVIAMKRSGATKAFTEYITERFGENEKLLLTASGIYAGIMTISEYLQCVIDGFIDMLDMVIILMLGYAMQEVMDTMGMEGLVQKICQMIPVVSLIPFVIFMIFSFTEFLYSLNYTLYQIAIPVMIVVLPKLGANLPLCIGAIISAGLFGANACVVSDLGIISARASRVTVYDQYESSLPYVLISGVVAAIMYLIAGFIF